MTAGGIIVDRHPAIGFSVGGEVLNQLAWGRRKQRRRGAEPKPPR